MLGYGSNPHNHHQGYLQTDQIATIIIKDAVDVERNKRVRQNQLEARAKKLEGNKRIITTPFRPGVESLPRILLVHEDTNHFRTSEASHA